MKQPVLTRLTSWLGGVGLTIRSYFIDNVSPRDPYMAMLFGGGTRTKSGQYVSEENALKLAPFFSAVSLLASSIASMPFAIDKLVNIEGEPDKEHYANDLLTTQPCTLFTPHTYKEWIMWRTLLKGNSYTLIDRDGSKMGTIDALWPLEPDYVKPFINNNGEKKYEYSPPKKANDKTPAVVYDEDEIIHIPAFMYDGLKGYGIIDFARESIGSGLATDDFAARFFAGDGVATGVITHPQRLKKESKINIKESYKEQAKGIETASNSNGGRGVVVLDEGMTFSKTGSTPEEGQLLATRQFSAEEVCRWLHIPPFMLAMVNGATSLSAEEQYTFFLQFGLRPWINRIEQEFNVKLLNKIDRKTWTCRFNTESLNLMTRDKQLDNLAKARNLGVLTLNDVSKELHTTLLPPGKDGQQGAGDQRIVPSTMKVLGGTDPSTPVDLGVLTGFTELISNKRGVTRAVALALAELLMPSADKKLIKKIIKPLLLDSDPDEGDEDDDDTEERNPPNLRDRGRESGNQRGR